MIRTGRTLVGTTAAAALWIFSRLLESGHRLSTVSRRNFVRNATLGAILIILAQLGVGFVRFFWPNKTGAFGTVITVPGGDVPAVDAEPYRNTAGKFYLVRNEDGVMALYWKCTHLGCTVPWVDSEDRFHCPCHGSIFFENGVKESGPAPRPMDYFPVTVSESGDVQVDTGSPTSRGDYEPSQAAPFPA